MERKNVLLNSWSYAQILKIQLVREEGTRHFIDGSTEEFTQYRHHNPVVATQYGIYRDVVSEFDIPLFYYALPDGTKYFEFIQQIHWTNEPLHLIALKDENGEVIAESLWITTEIQQL